MKGVCEDEYDWIRVFKYVYACVYVSECVCVRVFVRV